MCLAIPGKVVEVMRENDLLVGKVDFGGICRRICLEYVPEVTPGQYVLAHVGFAIACVDEAEAKRIFAMFEEIELDELRSVPE